MKKNQPIIFKTKMRNNKKKKKTNQSRKFETKMSKNENKNNLAQKILN